MKVRDFIFNVLPIALLLIILYFGLVGLLIEDRKNDLGLLYIVEVFISIIIVATAITIVGRVNILKLFGARNRLIVNQSPALYALYDLGDKTFKTSKNLNSILGMGSERMSFDGFLSILTVEDRSEICSIMQASKYSSNYSKAGIIKIAEPATQKEFFYRYIAKLVTGRFGRKTLCFWLFDYTDVVVDEIELVELVKKYRIASFELGQIIDVLPFPIWRQDLDGKVIFSNTKFNELKKKYSLELRPSEITSRQLNFVKRFITKDRVDTFAFSKFQLSDQSGYVGVCLNRTEIENTNLAIKTLENILEKLIENISVGFLVLDEELKVINFNLAFINIFSFDGSILAKKPNYRYVIDVLKDNGRFPELKGFKEKHLQDIREVKDCSIDLLHILNGVTVKVTIIPSKDGNTILTFENITPNLEAERELTKTKLMFNSVVSMIEFPMVIVSQNGQINFINNTFIETFFKHGEGSDVPSSFTSLINESVLTISKKDIRALREVLISCLESKQCRAHEFKVARNKYLAQTIGLDDLSVILIIKPVL
jgi:PAS domain-containing protein